MCMRGRPLIGMVMMLVFCSWTSAKAAPSFPVRITVPPPAGPPPLGAVAETSVPFPAGEIREEAGLMVTTSTGDPVIAQIRAAQRWADGSIRWLHLLFEAQKGPGDYLLKPGHHCRGLLN